MLVFHMFKKGFTLVELSIVLVIIGLLIGGILVGQSMIATSRVVATVKQFQQFDAGVENFKTKYNYLPGDATQFGGDGDGLVDTGSGYGRNDDFSGEMVNFWNNMDSLHYPYNSGNEPANYTVTTPVYTSGANTNTPLSAIGSNGAFDVVYPITVPGQQIHNYYAILNGTQLQPGATDCGYCGTRCLPTQPTAGNAALKPSELLALDTKMDDGIANTGNILSGDIEGAICGAGAVGVGGNPLTNCSNGGTYQVQHNSYECIPVIRIGATAGDLQ
jgi:prepilin-type N-terminal cleavage/methylation domain-containing protein